MKCENLQFNLPVYMDDFLSEDERAGLGAHLAQCPLCRQKLADFQSLRNDLRVLARPELSPKLLNSVRMAIADELHTKPKRIFSASFRHWLEMRLMPYAVGVAATFLFAFLLLGAMLSGANPVRQNSEFVQTKTSSVMLTKSNSNSSDFYTFDDDEELLITQQDFARHRISVSGESPSVNPAGAFVALTKSLVRGNMKDDEVVIVADVFGDGLAQIAQIVESPRDKKTLDSLYQAFNTASNDAPFVPAVMDKRADSVRVVFKIQLVDVITSKSKSRKR